MAEYSIAFARSARRELEALDSSVISRILSKIESLAAHPRPHGSCKLAGEKYQWRIRIGDYRVIYSILDKERHIDIAVACVTAGKLTIRGQLRLTLIAITLVWGCERAFDLELFVWAANLQFADLEFALI